MSETTLGPCSRPGCDRPARHATVSPQGEPMAWCYEDGAQALSGGPTPVVYDEPAPRPGERAFVATDTLLAITGWVALLIVGLSLLGSLIALAAVTVGIESDWAGWVVLVLLISATVAAAAWIGQKVLERSFSRRYA